MVKLTLPETPDHYLPIAQHPAVVRVVALSGGYTRQQACGRLSRNHAMIASFSRALVEDLKVSMTDSQFDASIAEAIEEIYRASTIKLS